MPNTMEDDKQQALTVQTLTDVLMAAAGSKSPGAKVEVMNVSPVIAEMWLTRGARNRPVSQTHVEYYARQMGEGLWQFNGDAIRFDSEGNLLDGQHRLLAVVRSKATIKTLVITGLSPEAQLTMDSGRKRSVGDYLALHGERYSTNLAATVRWVIALSTGMTNFRIAPAEVLDFIGRFPSVRTSAAKGSGIRGGTIPALISGMHFLATEGLGEAEKADRFVKVFRTGVQSYDGDPAHRLREIHLEARLAGKRINEHRQHMTMIHAWNLFRKDRKIQMFRLPQNEPVIEGLDAAKFGLAGPLMLKPASRTLLEFNK